MDLHETQMKTSIHQARKFRDNFEQDVWFVNSNKLPSLRRRTLQRIKDGDCSTWLSMMPTHDNHFLLSADEFRDSIALRYGRVPVKMAGFCDGCNQRFDLSHALNCKMGGLVGARHNESRDLNLDLLSLTGLTQTVREPLIKEPDSTGENALRVDWGVRGFWEFQ